MTTPGQSEALTALQQSSLDIPLSAHDQDDDEQSSRASEAELKGLWATARVFQCPKCKRLLDDPVELPCGNCICRACIPQLETRPDIDDTLWPGTAQRRQEFRCPCCSDGHTTDGCWSDRLTADVLYTTKIVLSGPTRSTQLVETFEMLSLGRIPDTDEFQAPTPPDDDLILDIRKLDHLLRSQMDCGICYQLLYEPWTTPCGHTFCRHCIKRALEQPQIGPHCPACRGDIALPYLDSRLFPPNGFLSRLTLHFWSDELEQRKPIVRGESPYPVIDNTGLDVPLFVCAVSFPGMPTFLHVFEPRYRAMIMRTWASGRGGKQFGMLFDRNGTIGTHLRVEAATFLSDGRSLLETKGVSRFRVKRQGVHSDGYAIAEVEDFSDVSLYEEEMREAADFRLKPEARNPEPEVPSNEDINWMKTKALMRFASRSITQMAATNPRWLNSRILAVFGECPNDPAVFPWWFACIFPIAEEQKLALLDTTTVRERMKIVCRWISNWSEPQPLERFCCVM